jgi:prepilin signal peptidase PulO-like enzyme (type II secretory pathway)
MGCIFFVFFVALGACIGSFLTMAVHRVPNMEDLVFLDSHCPKCNKKLRKRSLIPIISFLLQKGRCLECGEKIDKKYLFIELANTIIYAILFYVYGATFKTLYFGILASVIFFISYVDFTHLIVDVRAILILLLLAIIRILFSPSINPLVAIFGAISYYLFIIISEIVLKFIKKTNTEFIGSGDRKIIAVCGFCLTIDYIGYFFILSGIFGIATAVVWRLLKKGKKFPFGPALLFSLFTFLVW